MSVLWILAGILYTFSLPKATANTEIRNFDASPERVIAFPSAINSVFSVFNSTHRESTFQLLPAPLGTPLLSVCDDYALESRCPHELWLRLDLEDPGWYSHSSFTLRISWPAFHPTEFDITLFSPEELAEHFYIIYDSVEENRRSPDVRSLTRVKHARIRLVDTGVRNPTLSADPELNGLVPFIVILEPLLLNVLPATVLPTVLFLIPTLAVSLILLPHLFQYLSNIAFKAQAELRVQHSKSE